MQRIVKRIGTFTCTPIFFMNGYETHQNLHQVTLYTSISQIRVLYSAQYHIPKVHYLFSGQIGINEFEENSTIQSDQSSSTHLDM